ncbi:MAG: phosphoglucomutase/phosphomannomutase family protein [Candidatus Omnitrophica bacterium]|nr:phosphoglucomutase/phosphomannomutase family protein [Candidatus Omnitrophota bacterium]
MAIVFGTEGWRAVMADEFTVANVRIVAQAIAEHYLAATPGAAPRLVVGYDTRFLSDRFARAVSEVLAGNGIATILSTSQGPTCAVSQYIVRHKLTAGVMITASHNPPVYNGIKIKEAFGGSASPEVVASVEKRLGGQPPKILPLDDAEQRGLVTRQPLMPDYVKGLRAGVNLAAIRRSTLRVVVDPMHGAAGNLTERLLAGGRCKVETLHANPDPLFGGQAPEPIASHLVELSRRVKQLKWDVGLATDGDADRIGAMAPNGVFVSPGQILCILLEHFITAKGWTGPVVKTVSNTSMITRMAQHYGLPLHEVPVGFKHVAKLMLSEDVLIGGEESGGIGVRGYLPERDGVYLGLLLLEALAAQGRGVLEVLKRLERRFGAWRYARQDLTLSMPQVERVFQQLRGSPPRDLVGAPVREVKTLDGVKLIAEDETWLLFRRSGTEPIVRVYAESLSPTRLKRVLAYGVELAQRA